MQTSIAPRPTVTQGVVTELDAVLSEDSPATLSPPANDLDEELRNRIIAEKAYYLAEARGFAGGSELEDWLMAEAEVNQFLGGSCITV